MLKLILILYSIALYVAPGLHKNDMVSCVYDEIFPKYQESVSAICINNGIYSEGCFYIAYKDKADEFFQFHKNAKKECEKLLVKDEL